ncbi:MULTISPECIES: hypothetical protein [Bacillus]|uniref:hypothetical protein n=1 Tax=Bacillus TaxID=1386 RepID=UPI001C5B3B85|nr:MULTISPECIES: hypothetical protein [Bacillus]MBW3496190.1 hypothetical protein [Bacillus sp. FDAARGOS_1420]MDI6504850.1 hypothetical protein [Bacillus wiedmannii]MDI6510751.1 hypothetical protein [Bacillus wiedmannii]
MIKLSLLENAYDSIQNGVEYLESAVKTENIYDYKHAVLNLCQGTELLLKEILFLKNPIYAFDKNSLFNKCENPLDPTLEELYECKSLDVNSLCYAVAKYAPDFSGNEKVNLKIYEKRASKLRNKVQHFCFAIKSEEVREIVLKLYHQVIAPALLYINKQPDHTFEEKLGNIFCSDERRERHEMMLNLQKEDYAIGNCFSCGHYSFFIMYRGNSYPTDCYCTTCSFTIESIIDSDYLECPECGINSLVYNHELEAGTCLNYRCANHRDGGVLVDMEYCSSCREYRIEDTCQCEEEE